MKLDFETKFTQAEYGKFAAAVKERKGYGFCLGTHKDKMQVRIYGTVSDNGNWQPENYYWSISTTDRRGGCFSSGSRPYRISEMKSYEDIVAIVYDAFKLPRPAGFQQTFFD